MKLLNARLPHPSLTIAFQMLFYFTNALNSAYIVYAALHVLNSNFSIFRVCIQNIALCPFFIIGFYLMQCPCVITPFLIVLYMNDDKYPILSKPDGKWKFKHTRKKVITTETPSSFEQKSLPT